MTSGDRVYIEWQKRQRENLSKADFYLQTSKCNEIHESEISEMMHVAF